MTTRLLLFVVVSGCCGTYLIRKLRQGGKSQKDTSIHGDSEYTNVILPDLFQSFLRHPPKVNPHYNTVKLESEDWLARLCSFGPKMQMEINKCDFSFFCAIAVSSAPRDKLRMVCDWGNMTFPYDDMFDNGELKDQPEKATEVMDSFMDTMEGRKTGGTKLKLVQAHDACVKIMAAETSPSVQKRYASAVRAYSSAVIKHIKDRDTHKTPTLEDMVITRRESAGTAPVYPLVEYAYGLNIPDEVFENPSIQELQILGQDMVSISNDIVSYKKEESEAVPHNMVAICRRGGMSAQEAFDTVGSLLEQRFRRWETVEQSVPSWGEKADPDVKQYIEGIKSVVSANMNWSFKSERYLGRDAPEIKRTRKIQVLRQPAYLSKGDYY